METRKAGVDFNKTDRGNIYQEMLISFHFQIFKEGGPSLMSMMIFMGPSTNKLAN